MIYGPFAMGFEWATISTGKIISRKQIQRLRMVGVKMTIKVALVRAFLATWSQKSLNGCMNREP